jgi:hypothetical protein
MYTTTINDGLRVLLKDVFEEAIAQALRKIVIEVQEDPTERKIVLTGHLRKDQE